MVGTWSWLNCLRIGSRFLTHCFDLSTTEKKTGEKYESIQMLDNLELMKEKEAVVYFAISLLGASSGFWRVFEMYILSKWYLKPLPSI
jgi:hypothetical protein